MLAAALLLGAGCAGTRAGPRPIADPHYTSPDGAYRLELPLGWLRDGQVLMRDVPESPTIAFNSGPVLEDVPGALDPSAPQLMQAMSDQLANQPGVTVIECRAVQLDGLPGFRLHFAQTQPEPRREQLIYGAVEGRVLYAFSYSAGSAFVQDLAAFEALVASFTRLR